MAIKTTKKTRGTEPHPQFYSTRNLSFFSCKLIVDHDQSKLFTIHLIVMEIQQFNTRNRTIKRPICKSVNTQLYGNEHEILSNYIKIAL